MFNKLIILGIAMSSALSGYAKSYSNNCFKQHILESISINTKRKQDYAKLTQGRSNRIFNTLIAYETVTLAPASYFDLLALPFQKQGIELFCHEFMGMNQAPQFDSNNRIKPTEVFKPFDWKFYKERMEIALKHGNETELKSVLVQALEELKSMPHYYCMTRHLLESIYRFAHFMPIRIEEAQVKNLKSPKKIITDVMKLHLLGMKESHKIDLLSQPIQKSGIPILCSEIPNLLFDLETEELVNLK
jgi:hypothetical protein